MKKTVVVLLHFGYWVLYLSMLVFILACLYVGTNLKHADLLSDFRFETFFAAFATVPAICGFYAFYTVLFIQFLTRKKILLLSLFGILSAIISGVIGATAVSLLASFKIGPSIFNDGWSSATAIIGFMALVAALNGGMGLLLRGFIAWYEDLKTKEELAKKHFETELALVKSQIDPHFLFNTINNIDVLISKDAIKASLYLNKLSDIMRFMLYETKTEKIPLRKELDYVERYVELQKIRSSIPDYVNYESSIETDNIQIAPMVFIPFVENAFKHAEKTLKTSNAINIRVQAKQGNIRFDCTNKCHPDAPTSAEHSGLGNELIKKRLELLYPQRHSLNIEKSADTYSVKLVITQHEN